MKILFTFMVLLIVACTAEKKVGEDSSRPEREISSPRREATGNASGINIMVDYGSPAVKGRRIWGGLEKYDRVWRAGANETTAISFDKDALINGEPIDKGKYAIFIIPKENEDWTVIFNQDWDEWGAFRYNQERDVLRFTVSPEWSDNIHERLEYSIEEGNLTFRWEKVSLSMAVSSRN